jgi:hypothetical protein
MPNLPTKIVLFLSSYMPLFLIMAVKYGGKHYLFGSFMVFLAVASVAILLYYVRSAKILGTDVVAIEKISGKDSFR